MGAYPPSEDINPLPNPETSEPSVPNEMNIFPFEPKNLLGKTIANYTLLETIAQGSTGTIYLSQDTTNNDKVALKLLHPLLAERPESVKRFLLEARSLAKVYHPNVVQIQEVGTREKYYYLVMQFVDGHTLEDEIREKKSDWKAITTIILSVAKGLAAVHKEGIIHRDIKPENIMISNKGEVKITDFGLVRDQDSDLSMTKPGDLLGTPFYMSPEQCLSTPLDIRSDIYSLGVSYYYGLTRVRPFEASSLPQIIIKHIKMTPPSPLSIVPSLPVAIEQVINKMIAKDPVHRYQNMDGLIKDLELLLQEKLKTIRGETKKIIALPNTMPFNSPLLKNLKSDSNSDTKVIKTEKEEDQEMSIAYQDPPDVNTPAEPTKKFKIHHDFFERQEKERPPPIETTKKFLLQKEFQEARQFLESRLDEETDTGTLRTFQDWIKKTYQMEITDRIKIKDLKIKLKLSKQAFKRFPDEIQFHPYNIITQALKDSDANWRFQAVKSLASSTQDSIPFKERLELLIEALEDKEPEVQMQAIKILGDFGEKAESSIPFLTELAKQNISPEFAVAVKETLKKIAKI